MFDYYYYFLFLGASGHNVVCLHSSKFQEIFVPVQS